VLDDELQMGGLDRTGTGYGQIAGLREHCNELSRFIEVGTFLTNRGSQFFKIVTTPWTSSTVET
jgi:hypothetical protein